MARLYADENSDFPVVVNLRKLGHDVVTAQEAGRGGQGIPDSAVLAHATADARALLTFDGGTSKASIYSACRTPASSRAPATTTPPPLPRVLTVA